MAKKKNQPQGPVMPTPGFGGRISDATELLRSLQWAVHKAMSEDDYWMVLALFRASLPTLGAVLEDANVLLGESPIGIFTGTIDGNAQRSKREVAP